MRIGEGDLYSAREFNHKGHKGYFTEGTEGRDWQLEYACFKTDWSLSMECSWQVAVRFAAFAFFLRGHSVKWNVSLAKSAKTFSPRAQREMRIGIGELYGAREFNHKGHKGFFIEDTEGRDWKLEYACFKTYWSLSMECSLQVSVRFAAFAFFLRGLCVK
jgi:hypothetical protein